MICTEFLLCSRDVMGIISFNSPLQVVLFNLLLHLKELKLKSFNNLLNIKSWCSNQRCPRARHMSFNEAKTWITVFLRASDLYKLSLPVFAELEYIFLLFSRARDQTPRRQDPKNIIVGKWPSQLTSIYKGIVLPQHQSFFANWPGSGPRS